VCYFFDSQYICDVYVPVALFLFCFVVLSLVILRSADYGE